MGLAEEVALTQSQNYDSICSGPFFLYLMIALTHMYENSDIPNQKLDEASQIRLR